MHNTKNESSESIEIMQEHNWIMNFLKDRLVAVKNASASSDPDEYEHAKNNLNEFVNNLRKHFREEELTVFPLTLRADAGN
jgi:hemerythrin-like domain-containing protein